MTRPGVPNLAQQPAQPSMTWERHDWGYVILMDGKPVADGATMAEALQALGEQLRKAEKEVEARS